MNREEVYEILDGLLQLKRDADKWDDARFDTIKRISNSKVGDVGQDFVETLCGSCHFDVEFPRGADGQRIRTSPWDIKIGGVTFELKTASEDVHGKFQFNHIRYHRLYDALLCVGIAPNDIWFGAWSKAEVATGKAGHMVSMEKGATASHKLTKSPQTLRPIDEFCDRLAHLVDTL